VAGMGRAVPDPRTLRPLGLTPWTTLSEFSWHLEDEHWIIHALFFGFLLGLAMHIVFKGEMWKTQLAGLVFAFLVHFVNNRWP